MAQQQFERDAASAARIEPGSPGEPPARRVPLSAESAPMTHRRRSARHAAGRPTRGAPRPAAQQPDWPDAGALDAALDELARLPPLVFAGEARTPHRAARRASPRARRSCSQAGDCAESFDAFSADAIRDKLKVILQMSVVLTYGTRRARR